MSSLASDMYAWRLNKKEALTSRVKTVKEPLDKEVYLSSLVASGVSLLSFVLIEAQKR